MEAAFTPEVNDELDTQNFEKFEEVLKYFSFFFCIAIHLRPFSLAKFSSFYTFHLQADSQTHSSSRAGPWRKVILDFCLCVGNCHTNCFFIIIHCLIHCRKFQIWHFFACCVIVLLNSCFYYVGCVIPLMYVFFLLFILLSCSLGCCRCFHLRTLILWDTHTRTLKL